MRATRPALLILWFNRHKGEPTLFIAAGSRMSGGAPNIPRVTIEMSGDENIVLPVLWEWLLSVDATSKGR
jgi:hypothetical protein